MTPDLSSVPIVVRSDYARYHLLPDAQTELERWDVLAEVLRHGAGPPLPKQGAGEDQLGLFTEDER